MPSKLNACPEPIFDVGGQVIEPGDLVVIASPVRMGKFVSAKLIKRRVVRITRPGKVILGEESGPAVFSTARDPLTVAVLKPDYSE